MDLWVIPTAAAAVGERILVDAMVAPYFIR